MAHFIRAALGAIVILAGGGALAQEPAAVLKGIQEEFATVARHRDLPAIREADRILGKMAALREAPEKVREEACLFLARIVGDSDGSEQLFRLRATALRWIGVLADHPARVDFLISVAERAGGTSFPELQGLDLFAERALGEIAGDRLLRQLTRRVEDKNDAVVRAVLGGLGRLEGDRWGALGVAVVPRLVALAAHREAEMRSRAVRVLGRVPDARTLSPLLHAIQDKDPLVRLAAAEALGRKLDRPGGEAMLARLLEDPVARVREEAAIAFRRAGGRSAVPVLIARLAKEPLRVRGAIGTTLEELTGADLGESPQAWERWLTSARAAGTVFAAGGRGARSGSSRYAVTYYGIPVLSDRLVFILDVSGSMEFSTEGRSSLRRLQVAQRELVKALQSLDARTDFNIVTFAASVDVWKRGGLMKADKENVRAAVSFVESRRGAGGTNSYEALQATFEGFPAADTFCFLSDGSPTVGRTTVQDRIVREVHEWNRLRGVRIHTIALLSGEAPSPMLAVQDDKSDAARFMESLAQETGGTFVRRS